MPSSVAVETLRLVLRSVVRNVRSRALSASGTPSVFVSTSPEDLRSSSCDRSLSSALCSCCVGFGLSCGSSGESGRSLASKP